MKKKGIYRIVVNKISNINQMNETHLKKNLTNKN